MTEAQLGSGRGAGLKPGVIAPRVEVWDIKDLPSLHLKDRSLPALPSAGSSPLSPTALFRGTRSLTLHECFLVARPHCRLALPRGRPRPAVLAGGDCGWCPPHRAVQRDEGHEVCVYSLPLWADCYSSGKNPHLADGSVVFTVGPGAGFQFSCVVFDHPRDSPLL